MRSGVALRVRIQDRFAMFNKVRDIPADFGVGESLRRAVGVLACCIVVHH